MADTTFDVVASGAGKEGVSKAAINASASKAFDWHLLSIVAWVSSLNRAVVLIRAMVIGKSAAMYAEVFSYYLQSAQLHGLDGLAPSTSPLASNVLVAIWLAVL